MLGGAFLTFIVAKRRERVDKFQSGSQRRSQNSSLGRRCPHMDNEKLKEVIKNEQSFLRAELQELKRCQLQYFISTVAGTGIIFGLLDKAIDGKEMFFLSPLIILIPCWWTFFDKATTITRLAGYSTFLEKQFASDVPKYFGYENSLKEFRKLEDKRKKILSAQRWGRLKKSMTSHPIRSSVHFLKRAWHNILGTLKLLALRTRHRYWIINWYTFFTLAVVCCSLSLRFKKDSMTLFSKGNSLIYFALGITILSSLYTLNVVAHLIRGKYSYERVTKFWSKVFRKMQNKESKEACDKGDLTSIAPERAP